MDMDRWHGSADRGHGSPYDRGSADAYYGRPYRPHYFLGASYFSEEKIESQLTDEQLAEYRAGYEGESARKDWGN